MVQLTTIFLQQSSREIREEVVALKVNQESNSTLWKEVQEESQNWESIQKELENRDQTLRKALRAKEESYREINKGGFLDMHNMLYKPQTQESLRKKHSQALQLFNLAQGHNEKAFIFFNLKEKGVFPIDEPLPKMYPRIDRPNFVFSGSNVGMHAASFFY
jgi:hypothetical protein